MAFIKAIISTIVAAVTAFGPLLFQLAPSAFEAKEDDILLNMSVISDTHLDAAFSPLAWFLGFGLDDMAAAKTPVDVVAVTGDLTNYGDEASIDEFEVERVKADKLFAIKNQKNTPDSLAFDEFKTAVWKDTPYGNTGKVLEKTISAL